MDKLIRKVWYAAVTVGVVAAVAFAGLVAADCTAAQLAAVRTADQTVWETLDCAALADVTYDLAVAVAVERGAPLPDASLRSVLEEGCDRERVRVLDGGAWLATRPLSVSDGGAR